MKNLLLNPGRILLMTMMSLLVLSSCSDDDIKPLVEESLVINPRTATLEIGDELEVEPIYPPYMTLQGNYTWSSSNPDVATVETRQDQTGLVRAIAEGSATIEYSSPQSSLKASMAVTVKGEEVEEPDDDGIIKVLAIGNSFSEDALENYLYELADSKNIPIVIGNLYIGGSSLEQHVINAGNDAPNYSYRKIENGVKTSTSETTIEQGILDEDWDYISLQQVSGQSGQFETYEASLPVLLEYVKERATNPEVQYILHQTWAYAQSSTHSDFPNYGSDQVTMYNAIVDAVRQAYETYDIDIVVPAGTAIQNGRNTLIGDNFTRDGYHLDLSIGRYTAASTWFEVLTGLSVVGNTFAPATLNETEAAIAQHAAHAAVQNPDEITILEEFQEVEAAPLSSPVLVNFGTKVAEGWNTLGSFMDGAMIENLKDAENSFTTVSIEITERFNAMNTNGANETNTDMDMPAEVSSQSYYGNSQGTWQGLEIRQSVFVLSGLQQDATYNLCFYGSRTGVGDNRETKFIVEGENTETTYVQTANNTDEIGCAEGVRPDENGQITVTVTAGENNNNGSGFYYLGAMRLAPGE